MAFTSLRFLVFSSAIWLALRLYRENRWRVGVLLGASLVFYGSWGIGSLVWVVIVAVVTWVLTRQIHRGSSAWPYALGTLLLAYLAGRFLPEVLTRFNAGHLLGHSYFTLQAIGYLSDVRSKKTTGKQSFASVLTFLSYFPQALAGPINRGPQFFPQLGKGGLQKVAAWPAVKRILYGYFCKIIVADKLGVWVDPVLDDVASHAWLTLVLYSTGYSLQIYFDFWGYTLIVTGLSSLFGIEMSPNFNSPYFARSFTDFWRRWHISLSSWLRDYVYLPLGGSRQWYFPLTILFVFALSGFWHGLGPNFILWAFIHGIFVAVEKLIISKYYGFTALINTWLGRLVQRMLFLTLLAGTWLVFRTPDLSFLYGRRFDNSGRLPTVVDPRYLLLLGLTLILLLADHRKQIEAIIQSQPATMTETFREVLFVNAVVISLFLLGELGQQEFIYFNF